MPTVYQYTTENLRHVMVMILRYYLHEYFEKVQHSIPLGTIVGHGTNPDITIDFTRI